MTAPKLKLDVLPSKGGKVYYLPLAPKSADHGERLKIGVRLKITHIDPDHDSLDISNITFSFPDTDLGLKVMEEENRYMDPEGGVLKRGESAFWCNGSVETDTGMKKYNQIYFDAPAPPKLKIDIRCMGFTHTYSETFDLIRWTDPTGKGPLLMPFALHDLADDEYIVTSARHWFNGKANGTQIFAHDISIQARVNGKWTRSWTGEASSNSDVRVFGRPVRAMADGEVIAVEDGHDDNPYDDELEDATSNLVWVRYGDLEVKYSHLRKGSILVRKDQAVKSGQKLAEAGNSGNTGGSPHLHMECRVAATNTLCPMTFRNAWQLERDLVPATGRGRRIRIDAQGICEEKAAIRPFATRSFTPDIGEIELDELAAEVFGGVSKGGDGFVIVGGKIVKVPPRGIRAELLRAIVGLDEAEELGAERAAQRRKDAAGAVEKALRALKAER